MLSAKVVIVSYNTCALTLRSVASVQGSSKNVTITVVDNASSDGTVAALRTQFPDVIVLCNATNMGFARAVNQGCRDAKEDVVVLLNPDAEAQGDTLTKLLQVLQSNPRLGAVGPLVLSPNGVVQHHCAAQRLSVAGQLLWRLALPTSYSRLHLGDPCGPHGARITQRLSGSAMAIRRKVLAQLGFFDEGFFMYFEDADLSERIQAAGFFLACVTEASVIHLLGASSQQQPRARLQQALASELRYFSKHTGRAQNVLLRVGVASHAALHLSTLGLARALKQRRWQALADDLEVLRQLCAF